MICLFFLLRTADRERSVEPSPFAGKGNDPWDAKVSCAIAVAVIAAPAYNTCYRH
jgi:hypothetical protein